MTNYTPAQLEAWAGLGPWCALGTDPAEGVDCFWIKGQPNPAMRGFSDEIAAVNGSQNDPKRQTNAALIAAAPDLARLVLEKEKEIARLRKALKPFVDATRLADLRRLENDDVLLKLTWPSKKGHTCLANLGPCQIEAARQAMKETSDEAASAKS